VLHILARHAVHVHYVARLSYAKSSVVRPAVTTNKLLGYL